MNIETERLREYTRRAQTTTDGEALDIVADVMSDQLEGQMEELEVQMKRLLADVALATRS